MNEKDNPVCSGCGRRELHKLCPAWGTKYYMSGTLFTKELEEECKEERDKNLKFYNETYKGIHID